MKSIKVLLLAGMLAVSGAVLAHGDEDHSTPSGPVKKEQKDWGIAGEAKAAKRTVAVRMTDNMRFTPDRIQVKQGETVRFSFKNDGKLMHEFVLGTKKELDEHAALMMKFPNMEHDEPYMAHVAPGKTGEIVWTFNRPGDFDFACLIAGHYEAGMVGKVKVVAASGARQGTAR
ncbi:cupredoxin domain-containing protein [Variovorax sp. JS1663]|uniref:cupredoxin domain-containing protein n=1 Tax=Variovorax sp. JS1663 TaxID=1851577 RepID=UPI000B34358F|nr:cupredoxin family protein [Variovorax sp. JS1663]OUM00405.1 plastocyanin [Variovorax sp. JS1663]